MLAHAKAHVALLLGFTLPGLLPCFAAQPVGETPDPIVVRGCPGRIGSLEIAVPAAKSVAPLVAPRRPADIDLKRMAEWALNYLTESPRKHLNYDPVFQCFPLQCPPAPLREDPIVACDTDARMDWEWYYMRDIAGSEKGREVEEAFHKRMRGYLDADGVVWASPGCHNEGAINATYDKKDYIIHTWGMSKILQSLGEDYARTHNPDSKALARKMIKQAKALATWDSQGRCWYACGMGGFKADRKTPAVAHAHPVPIVEALIVYWQATGNQEALDFAKAYAEGMLNNLQPGGIRFQPDGSFNGHSHMTMHSVWGVAHLGLLTGERRYLDFAKRAWDWMSTRGTGTGWFPAMPDSCSEVCCLSDMMSTAAVIAQDGHPEYYDFIERYLRNYISPLQFVVTPEFEARYRALNKAKGEDAVRQGLAESRKFQGGFFNAGLNDFENDLLGGGGYVWKIAGCCAPEGMRATYTTWLNTIQSRPRSALGPAGIYVNMSFSRQSPWGEVVSFLPEQGRLTVKSKIKSLFFLRPPHWAPRDQVQAFINAKPVPAQWSGAYLRLKGRPGDELTITYPLVRYTQQVEGLWPVSAPKLKMTFNWLGNMVVSANPPAKPGSTALFTGKIHSLPPVPGITMGH